MSDSDRQLFFANFVIDLQAAEDEKRRRIHDARKRAEKAQRDAYRDALQRMAIEGKILPSSRWRDVEGLVALDSTFLLVQEQDRDAPRDLFEEFVDEWYDVYRRDRPILSRLVYGKREILVKKDTTYDAFVKALLEEAQATQHLYSEVRQIIRNDHPVSSARVYFNELIGRAKDKAVESVRRRPSRRSSLHESSSEDEGEIIEEGEVKDETKNLPATSEPAAFNSSSSQPATATITTEEKQEESLVEPSSESPPVGRD